jgi:hypothetical protein
MELEDCIRAVIEKECGQYLGCGEMRETCETRTLERMLNETQTEMAKLSTVQAIGQAGRKWMTRFGIDFEKDQEADVKLEVARRKQVVFVAVLNRCFAALPQADSRCESACGTPMQKWEPTFQILDARWGVRGDPLGFKSR